MHRIVLVDFRHYARLDHVRIEPDADQHLYLIAGMNTQGKSSLIGAIETTLAGKKRLPPVPVKVGEARAENQIDLVDDTDGRVYKVRRVIEPDGETKLEIRGPDGLVPKPQTWLDRIMGGGFLDPMSFLDADAKVQRKTLLQVAGVNTDALDAEFKRTYDRREEEGRALSRAKGQYDSLPTIPPEPQPARSMAVVNAELRQVEDDHRAITALLTAEKSAVLMRAQLESARDSAQRAFDEARIRFETAERALSKGIDEHLDARSKAAAGAAPDKVTGLVTRRQELVAEAGRSETAARWQATAQAMRSQHDRAKKQVADGEALRASLTETMANIQAQRATLLMAAPMPVPGLTVTEDGVLLDGIPFEQASQAQRIRTALVIAMSLAKDLRVVLVRDGSHLDENAIAALREAATELDCWIWVEVVGERHEGAIIMREGRAILPAGG